MRDTTNFPVEVICGKYKFEVDENFKVKYIGEADGTVIKYTTEPEDFTPEIQKADNSITIIENGKDADATEESCKSGIDHYEYYLIDASNKETKYDTNKIENLELGSYKLYVIAYDKAGNSKKSNTVDFKISKQFKIAETGGYHT